ncbi:MAG: hypothetical protein ACK5QS_07355 [Pseudanabaenaceae cyanobacterium]
MRHQKHQDYFLSLVRLASTLVISSAWLGLIAMINYEQSERLTQQLDRDNLSMISNLLSDNLSMALKQFILNQPSTTVTDKTNDKSNSINHPSDNDFVRLTQALDETFNDSKNKAVFELSQSKNQLEKQDFNLVFTNCSSEDLLCPNQQIIYIYQVQNQQQFNPQSNQKFNNLTLNSIDLDRDFKQVLTSDHFIIFRQISGSNQSKIIGRIYLIKSSRYKNYPNWHSELLGWLTQELNSIRGEKSDSNFTLVSATKSSFYRTLTLCTWMFAMTIWGIWEVLMMRHRRTFQAKLQAEENLQSDLAKYQTESQATNKALQSAYETLELERNRTANIEIELESLNVTTNETKAQLNLVNGALDAVQQQLTASQLIIEEKQLKIITLSAEVNAIKSQLSQIEIQLVQERQKSQAQQSFIHGWQKLTLKIYTHLLTQNILQESQLALAKNYTTILEAEFTQTKAELENTIAWMETEITEAENIITLERSQIVELTKQLEKVSETNNTDPATIEKLKARNQELQVKNERLEYELQQIRGTHYSGNFIFLKVSEADSYYQEKLKIILDVLENHASKACNDGTRRKHILMDVLKHNSLSNTVEKSGSIALKVTEPDLYPDEKIGIILHVLKTAADKREQDSRQYYILQDILDSSLYNEHKDPIKEMRELVKISLNNYTRMTPELEKDLRELGFEIVSENNHYKLVFCGDSSYTSILPKTPSDKRRGARNSIGDILSLVF